MTNAFSILVNHLRIEVCHFKDFGASNNPAGGEQHGEGMGLRPSGGRRIRGPEDDRREVVGETTDSGLLLGNLELK
jgi:hypothetical protein